MESPFVTDIAALRARAREHIERGAVTDAYQGPREVVLSLLDAALATELVCVLRYLHHAFMASGLTSEPVAEEFRQHAQEEHGHALLIAERITQLGGAPSFDPSSLTGRSHSEYAGAGSLTDMIRENLVAERIAIESYLEMIRFIGEKDPTTRRMLEDILSKEEEHARELADLLIRVGRPEEPPGDEA
jgi:bacterioferritin